MSKERLDKIIYKAERTALLTRPPKPLVTIPDEDFEWLVEQAKRAQELEQDVREWEIVNESWEEINTQIVEQNKRYKRALEEISNADWNSEGLDAERELDKVTDIAFKALEESK